MPEPEAEHIFREFDKFVPAKMLPEARRPVTTPDVAAVWRQVAAIRERAGQTERAARARWNASNIAPGGRKPNAMTAKRWCARGFK
jgi:hypothetical protein